jgi:hypothetical protein
MVGGHVRFLRIKNVAKYDLPSKNHQRVPMWNSSEFPFKSGAEKEMQDNVAIHLVNQFPKELKILDDELTTIQTVEDPSGAVFRVAPGAVTATKVETVEKAEEDESDGYLEPEKGKRGK